MRILYVGNKSIPAPLRDLGHDVISVFDNWPAVNRVGRPFDIRDIWWELQRKADLLLVVDTLGRQTLPYGVEDIPVPRVYWAIDVHLNCFWQKHYGRLFDLVLVAQRDYVPVMEQAGVVARWLPWGADESVFYDRELERVHQLCFVGTVDAATRPKRAALVALLKKRFGMVTFGETIDRRLTWPQMADAFSASKIVFNEAIMGELNFRVFEAMACGAMLLTEEIGNGLTELFEPGLHLDVYTPETLVAKVEHYLEVEEERTRIARAGTEEVHKRHSLTNRVATLMQMVEDGVSRAEAPSSACFDFGMTAHLTVVRGLAQPSVGVPLAVANLIEALDTRWEGEAAMALGRIFAWADKKDKALAILERARMCDSSNVLAWFVGAEIAYACDKVEDARELLKSGVRAAPGVTTTTRRRALEALDGDIRSSACLYLMGLVLQEAGLPIVPGMVKVVDARLPWAAYDYFQQAIMADPTNAEAVESMASLLDFAGMASFSVPFREASVSQRPWDAEFRERLSNSLLAAYRLEDAARERRIVACLRGVEPEGTVMERMAAHREAARALVLGERGSEALELLGKAAASGLNTAELLKDCALVCLDLHDYRSARGWLEKIVERADASSEEVGSLFQLLEELEEKELRGS